MVALAGMAGLYFLLHAEFLAAVQLLVFVGGTCALLLMGIVLTGKGAEPARPKRAEVFWAVGVALAVGVTLIVLLIMTPWRAEAERGQTEAGGRWAEAGPGQAEAGERGAGPTIEQLGGALVSSGRAGRGGYLIVVELVSLLLVTVMIGAAYLMKARRAPPPAGPPVMVSTGPSPTAPGRGRLG
jgi:NADH-quinone oxidoreductase subunit J